MTFYTTTGLLKTAILDRLQRQKKNKTWGISVRILPLSWIPKSWTTLQAFHRLLIQPHRSNGLDVTEFCASAKLLKLFWTAQQLEGTKFWGLSKSEAPEAPNTIPIGNSLRFLMLRYPTQNGQRHTSYGYQKMTGLLNLGKSRQTWPSDINQDFGEILPWHLQKLCIQKNVVNEISFTLVTHTAYFDTQLGRYEFLKIEQGAELFWAGRMWEWNSQVWGLRSVNLGNGCLQIP
jgi:hypothetical protein